MTTSAERIGRLSELVAELEAIDAAVVGGSDLSALLERHVAAMNEIAFLSSGADLVGYRSAWMGEHGGREDVRGMFDRYRRPAE